MKQLTLVIALIGLVAGSALAQPGPDCSMRCGHRDPGMGMNDDGPGMRMGHGSPGMDMLMEIADQLELTDQQKDQVEKAQLEFQTQLVDRRAAVEKASIRLRHLCRDDNGSEKDVNAAIDDLARLRADMRKMQFSHRKQMMSILTDKQRDKLKELRKDRVVKMERRIKVIEEEGDAPVPMPGRGRRGL